MENEELVDLCKKIYAKHKEAINLIMEYGASTNILSYCSDFVRDEIGVEFALERSNAVWFCPEEMGKKMKPASPGWKFLPKAYPVVWWFRYSKKGGKLHLILEIGPVDDFKVRKAYLDKAKELGFKFWETGAYRESAKYTRIYSAAKKLKLNEDGDTDDSQEYILGLIKSLWTEASDAYKKSLAISTAV